MIESLQLKGFKSFEDSGEIAFRPLTLLIGANATGKSNLRDALRLLHGVGLGYSTVEIIEGRFAEGGEWTWRGIRGGQAELGSWPRAGSKQRDPVRIVELWVTLQAPDLGRWRYYLAIDRINMVIRDEKLRSLDAGPFHSYAFKLAERGATFIDITCRQPGKKGVRQTFRDDRPVLAQIPDDRRVADDLRDACRNALQILKGLRFLDVSPNAARRYVHPRHIRLGDGGENLSAVLRSLADKDRTSLLEWLDQLTPHDIDGFHFFENEQGQVLLGVYEARSRKPISAFSMSDGSLRFLTLVTLVMLGRGDQTLLLEEIENGIHPSRLDVLVQLLEQFSQQTQIVASSHSPLVLKYLQEELWPGVIVLRREEQTGKAQLRSLTDLPHLQQAIKQDSLDFLMATGWMEEALS